MDDRTTHEGEIEQDRELIRRSRESIAETDSHIADSVDRLVESQKRLRREQVPSAIAAPRSREDLPQGVI